MGIERRRPEASVLRQLFQEQWALLTGLLEDYNSRREQEKLKDAEEMRAVESLVDGTNRRVKLLSDYRSELRTGVRSLLDHINLLVAEFPAAIDLTGGSSWNDPRVAAFFVNKDDVRETFSRSVALRRYFKDPRYGADCQAYAVMFMHRVEKNVLGIAQAGEQLMRDVRKVSVCFTSHLITLPHSSEPQVRSALERYLFERVVEYVNSSLARLRAESMKDAGKGTPDLNNPAEYLQHLSRILRKPLDLLRLESDVIRIDHMGFRVPAASRTVASDIPLHEVCLGAQIRNVVTLVSYPRKAMRSPEELLRNALPGWV